MSVGLWLLNYDPQYSWIRSVRLDMLEQFPKERNSPRQAEGFVKDQYGNHKLITQIMILVDANARACQKNNMSSVLLCGLVRALSERSHSKKGS